MFAGFGDQESWTPLPDSFFRLLNEMDDLEELKVALYALWRMAKMESGVHFLRQADFREVVAHPEAALEKAVRRGILLMAQRDARTLYFLNSPRGRAAAQAFVQGLWQPGAPPPPPPPPRPNVFRLYEENIGPLTPLLADALKDAEQTYPVEWIAEAIEIAVKKNKRNWKYVEAILKRWKVEGHAKKQDRLDLKETGRRYSDSEFAEYLHHGEN
jgi:DnaD/phage-associated family protein